MRVLLKLLIIIAAFILSVSCGMKGSVVEKIPDHSQIKGPFKTPQDVTKKCLQCHEEVGDDILKTQHWNWLSSKKVKRGYKRVRIGKANILNNYCVAVISNWPRCTSCHIGYGWKDKSFDFTKKENIDCLVCHDRTGTYKKFPTKAGYPVTKKTVFMKKKTFFPPDYEKIARNVGKPTRNNCGTCHFYGGGGDAVKHGDLDSGLKSPDKDLDVHMGGMNFSCTKCHKSESHNIMGALHASLALGANHLGCTDCHKDKVHENDTLNKHLSSVACQTCHIPEFARAQPTKMWWDWSTAGENRKMTKDKYGKLTWHKKKGSFRWEKNVVPEYFWYNGKQDSHIIGDKIKDPNKVFVFNRQHGSIKDPKARIMPFKVMRGIQAYDKVNKRLIVPHLFGKGGFWKTWDWNRSFRSGMKQAGLPYSGSYGWIKTEMLWPINHMVAPKSEALDCNDCHSEKGRLNWKALGYKGDPKKFGGR